MRRILALELKRSMSSNMTRILLAAALVLSVIMGMLVISYTEYHYLDDKGEAVKITGLKAIAANKKMMAPYKGQLTSEKIRGIVATNRALELKYGEDIPQDLYFEKAYPTKSIMGSVLQVYYGKDGLPMSAAEIKDADAKAFYDKRSELIENSVAAKYPEDTAAQETVRQMNGQIQQPLYFIYGYAQSDAADYVLFCLILLGIICAVLAAPVFSSGYQTGADDIFRCTKYGRIRLACARIVSLLIITTLSFIVSMGIFLMIVNTAYGWDSLQASAQFVWSMAMFAPLTSGGMQMITVAVGFAGVMAIVCFSLFLSSKCRTSMVAVILALLFCLLPTIISTALQGNLADWISCILPSGGAGLNHSFYYDLMGNTFLQAGFISVWSPYVIAAAAIIEIPLFSLLAIRSYCKHEA